MSRFDLVHSDKGQRRERTESDRLADFLSELTALSHRYNLGIAGSATLFVMEPVDKALRYGVDSHGTLQFV